MAIDIGGGGLGAVYLGDTLIAGGGGGGGDYDGRFVDVLVVGGGGTGPELMLMCCGKCSAYQYGSLIAGGGGAGGVIRINKYPLGWSCHIPVHPGKGGCSYCTSTQGQDSFFGGLLAFGGHGREFNLQACLYRYNGGLNYQGGGSRFTKGLGGSGGGTAAMTCPNDCNNRRGRQFNNCYTQGQGCPGGWGSGGGADGNGAYPSPLSCSAGVGGKGIYDDIDGTNRAYSFGGGGSFYDLGTNTYYDCGYYGGQAKYCGFGGHGGARCCGQRGACHGADGIVIVRYPLDGSYGFTCATGGNCCYDCNGYRIHKFTEVSSTLNPMSDVCSSQCIYTSYFKIVC